MIAIGLRSSWDASAMKRRWAENAESIRPSMASNVSASRFSSSSGPSRAIRREARRLDFPCHLRYPVDRPKGAPRHDPADSEAGDEEDAQRAEGDVAHRRERVLVHPPLEVADVGEDDGLLLARQPERIERDRLVEDLLRHRPALQRQREPQVERRRAGSPRGKAMRRSGGRSGTGSIPSTAAGGRRPAAGGYASSRSL